MLFGLSTKFGLGLRRVFVGTLKKNDLLFPEWICH